MKILILANHYLTLRVFRRELIQKLSESHEVIISLPEDSKEYMDELRSFGARLVYVIVVQLSRQKSKLFIMN